jgi:predicted alpha/beta hydrolase family esterase
MAQVTFIHGIGNKVASDALLRRWLDLLADDGGPDLAGEGVGCAMVYWADFLYPEPQAVRGAESSEALELQGIEDVEMGWLVSAEGEEAALVGRLAAKIGFEEFATAEPVQPPQVQEARELLPPFVARQLMKTFLRDVHHYLFNARFTPRPGQEYKIQEVIRQRVVETLRESARQPGPHVVVSHSMGTVIVYDCLKRVADCPPIDGLMTIGSPLGLDEVQHPLKPAWTREDGFPAERLTGRWVNVYDRLDLVAAADPELSDDYQRDGARVVVDVDEPNYGRWRHDIGKYFAGGRLRAELAGLLGTA